MQAAGDVRLFEVISIRREVPQIDIIHTQMENLQLALMKAALDFIRFLNGGFHQTPDNIGRNAL